MVLVYVHNGELEQSLRAFRKKVQREGISRKIKISYYEKPSEKKKRKRAESERRRRKLRKTHSGSSSFSNR